MQGLSQDQTAMNRSTVSSPCVTLPVSKFQGRIGRTCQRDQCMTKRVLVSEAYHTSMDRIRSVISQYEAVSGNA